MSIAWKLYIAGSSTLVFATVLGNGFINGLAMAGVALVMAALFVWFGEIKSND